MYLYDKNMVVTTNHKYAELPWEWEYPWGFPYPWDGNGNGKDFFPVGIPIGFLWGFPQDSYGNGMGMETEIPFPRQPCTKY